MAARKKNRIRFERFELPANSIHILPPDQAERVEREAKADLQRRLQKLQERILKEEAAAKSRGKQDS